MNEIDKKIQDLEPEKSKIFHENLKNCFYDRTWCVMNHINYNNFSSQDILHAREIVYKDLFEDSETA